MGQGLHKGPIYQDTPNLTRPEGKGGKIGLRMASERQINRLPCLLAVKIFRQ